MALGEIGLDYYHLPDTIRPEGAGGTDEDRQIKSPGEFKDLQKEVLTKFLELSEKTRLPTIIHCRDAQADMISLLENFDHHSVGFDARGVMHCFSGNWEEARRYFNLGFLISFTGVITFAHFEGETLAKAPLGSNNGRNRLSVSHSRAVSRRKERTALCRICRERSRASKKHIVRGSGDSNHGKRKTAFQKNCGIKKSRPKTGIF